MIQLIKSGFLVLLTLLALASCSLLNGTGPDTGTDYGTFDPSNLVVLDTSNRSQEGYLASGDGAVWFIANVTPGATYSLSWEDASTQPATKSLYALVSAFHADHTTSYFSPASSVGTSTEKSIVVATGENKIYVKVEPAYTGGSGSFSLKLGVSSGTTSALTLGSGTYVAGNLSAGTSAVWYVATVSPGVSYSINWDDGLSPKSGTYNLDIKVSAYRSDGVTVYPFTDTDSGFASAQNLTVVSGETKVFFKVTPKVSGASGSFALMLAPTPTMSTDNVWKNENLTTAGISRWYLATVTGGQTYLLNWDDGYAPNSGTKTLDVIVSAYEANLSTSYFINEDEGYSTNRSLSVPVGQTKVWIKVTAFNTSQTGTFALKMTSTGSVNVNVQ